MAAMRRRGNKIPKVFYMIYVIAIVVAVLIAIALPFPEPAKIMVGMLLVVAFSLGGVWVYAKIIRK